MGESIIERGSLWYCRNRCASVCIFKLPPPSPNLSTIHSFQNREFREVTAILFIFYLIIKHIMIEQKWLFVEISHPEKIPERKKSRNYPESREFCENPEAQV